MNSTISNHSSETLWDVVTLGETMLRLTPDSNLRLEQAESLQVHVGGSESNTAVGLSRLGKRVAWLSRMTDNHLGRKVERAIAAHGVCTKHIVWTNNDRVGLYFLEAGTPPRNSQVIYDRANSAFSNFQPSDLPSDLFAPFKSKWLHITGISLWLSDSVRETVAEAVKRARSVGWQISFDVNHRSLLCSAKQARQYSQSLFESADLAFLPRRDANNLWGIRVELSDELAMSQLVAMRSGRPTVMTLGTRGAMASDANHSITQAIEPVEPIGRLGGGDSFSAGFLSAWLEEQDLRRSLQWATATARLKYSIPGDLPLISRQEVERLLDGNSSETLVR
ncbi:MAG: sugar kinase [Planctomycetota bacterium]|nr:sugar kinase [Planctomycetota bacterium]